MLAAVDFGRVRREGDSFYSGENTELLEKNMKENIDLEKLRGGEGKLDIYAFGKVNTAGVRPKGLWFVMTTLNGTVMLGKRRGPEIAMVIRINHIRQVNPISTVFELMQETGDLVYNAPLEERGM